MIKGACIIGQSGGPTAVINASLEGVIETAFQSEYITNVYGALYGIEGIINEEIIDFSNEDEKEITLLKTTPGASLGSVRFKMPSMQDDITIYQKLEQVLKKYDIHYFFYIGGNDSMDTCYKISEYFRNSSYECYVMGVPKTIDNDLEYSDHTPGYASSCKYIATTIGEIYQDIHSYKVGRVTIVEIMGRDTGWLTASSYLASINHQAPDLIYLPECAFDLKKFLIDVKKIYEKKQKVLVAISEGIKDKDGEYILKYRLYNNTDDFGHLQLGGVGQVLAEIVNKELKLPIRSIELNLPQRCATHLASLTDVKEAYMCGVKAVENITKGINGKMITMIRDQKLPYHIYYNNIPLKDVANKVKLVPKKYMNEENNNLNDNFIEYALPLIQGEVTTVFENGMPRFTNLKKQVIKK